MKKLISILFFGLLSIVGLAQETSNGQEAPTSQGEPSSQDESTIKQQSQSDTKYFISTNSGLLKTPIGFRIGVLDRRGGYIGARFGKGDVYNQDDELTQATLFSATAGLMFPIYIRNNFRIHTNMGIGYGQWFERLSANGQRVGFELELGLMISYEKILLSLGGNMLAGDGSSPVKDATIGLGYKF